MNEFLASIDKKRLTYNVIGYMIVLVLCLQGPVMTGFMGQAVWAYVWFYPIYYVGMLIYRFGRRAGGRS